MSFDTDKQQEVYDDFKNEPAVKEGTLTKITPGVYNSTTGKPDEVKTTHTVYILEDVPSGSVNVSKKTMGEVQEKKEGEEKPVHMASNGVVPRKLDTLNYKGLDWLIKSTKDETAGLGAMFLCMIE